MHVGFDGGRLTSDAGILLLATIEQRLKIAERLATCLEDPRGMTKAPIWNSDSDLRAGGEGEKEKHRQAKPTMPGR